MKVADINVELIDHMGSDLSVVNAARVSFAKKRHVIQKDDEKLISYLAKHEHWSPFAHAFLSFRVKAPVFVARQLTKHQVGLAWNEESRRYVDDEPEFYLPDNWRMRHENKKQGSHENDFIIKLIDDPNNDDDVVNVVVGEHTKSSLRLYNRLIDSNIAPEQARIVLPQNMMFNWIWSGSLYAFARVCNLRLDPHAQLECRTVAHKFHHHLQDKFPISAKALVKHFDDVLSEEQLDALNDLKHEYGTEFVETLVVMLAKNNCRLVTNHAV